MSSSSYDNCLQVRDSLSGRPGFQKRFIKVTNKMMVNQPLLFGKHFSGDIKQSTEVFVSICRQKAVMEGKDPDSLVFYDARIDRTLLAEAKQLLLPIAITAMTCKHYTTCGMNLKQQVTYKMQALPMIYYRVFYGCKK